MAGHGLSKSRLVAWKQCPKRLWLQIHRRNLIEVSGAVERGFQIGYEVGEVAQRLFPEGLLIGDDDDLSAALVATQAALAAHPEKPLFEATFQHDGVLVRADLLLPTPGGYRLVEVKASASVKPYHLADCAVQAWVLRQNGMALAAIELAHIDTAFVYQGNGNYHGLFHHAPLGVEVSSLMTQVPGWIQAARTTLAGDEPDIAPGAHCDDPFECPFKAHCNRAVVQPARPTYSLDVFTRMRASTKANLRSLGFEDACDVPEVHLHALQRRIQRVSQTGVAELTQEAAQTLAELPYPRYYLDFETINLAVPRWPSTSPYRTQVPFQWSCHTELASGQLDHAMFLDTSGNDPRRECAQSLVAALGSEGPVFVYSEGFEKGRINELAALFPDLAPALDAINPRIVDLLPLTRTSYCHPALRGSWSLKAVLPTIAPDLDYNGLLVGNGGDAQDAYREILHPETPVARKQALAEGLRDYCTLDTLGLVRLAWFLEGRQVWLFLPDSTATAATSPEIEQHPNPLIPRSVEILRVRCQESRTAAIVQPISFLQRHLKLGYSATLALADELERLRVMTRQKPAFTALRTD
ncbi:hypothetical protein RCH06_001648 [Polaromonas sp. CG_9.5]|uniref:DUF2779 domain-containing protein n=1 Tax=Polaromonas sp. CG_9.5 TaxID=3071705 RepID=UPI002E014D9E|nr:hypothetical protein [Polaromonas sp. CG_9.5]